MKSTALLKISILIVVVMGIIFYLVFRPITAHSQVLYVGGSLDVLVADSAIERTRGLSNTQIETLGADGMLFVFTDQAQRTFWMNEMNYALDVLWIQDGQIVKIDENVPQPGNDYPGIARMYSNPFAVQMVLELPAGQVQARGLAVGQTLTID